MTIEERYRERYKSGDTHSFSSENDRRRFAQNVTAHLEVWNRLRINDKGLTDIAGKDIPYNPGHVYRVRHLETFAQLLFFVIPAKAGI